MNRHGCGFWTAMLAMALVAAVIILLGQVIP